MTRASGLKNVRLPGVAQRLVDVFGCDMAPTVLDGIDEIRAAVGRHLGYSDWLEITQDRIDQFAEATGDDQWIHVDPARAADGPFGATIAHGYLTLALTNLFLPQILDVQGVAMGVNYGADKLRFPAPVKVGAKVRGGAELLGVTEVAGGVQTTVIITVEIDGEAKPACVVESLSRYFA
jgi:acyl dehydratase